MGRASFLLMLLCCWLLFSEIFVKIEMEFRVSLKPYTYSADISLSFHFFHSLTERSFDGQFPPFLIVLLSFAVTKIKEVPTSG